MWVPRRAGQKTATLLRTDRIWKSSTLAAELNNQGPLTSHNADEPSEEAKAAYLKGEGSTPSGAGLGPGVGWTLAMVQAEIIDVLNYFPEVAQNVIREDAEADHIMKWCSGSLEEGEDKYVGCEIFDLFEEAIYVTKNPTKRPKRSNFVAYAVDRLKYTKEGAVPDPTPTYKIRPFCTMGAYDDLITGRARVTTIKNPYTPAAHYDIIVPGECDLSTWPSYAVGNLKTIRLELDVETAEQSMLGPEADEETTKEIARALESKWKKDKDNNVYFRHCKQRQVRGDGKCVGYSLVAYLNMKLDSVGLRASAPANSQLTRSEDEESDDGEGDSTESDDKSPPPSDLDEEEPDYHN